jgi:outer membrane immunogenic protein
MWVPARDRTLRAAVPGACLPRISPRKSWRLETVVATAWPRACAVAGVATPGHRLQQEFAMTAKLILGGVAGAVLLVAPLHAQAADMRYKAPVYKSAPTPYPMRAYWSGFYVGANVGYAWGESSVTTGVGATGTYFHNAFEVADVNRIGSGTINPKGFTGGIQAGYNWQTGNFVYGIEADVNFFSLKASRSVSTPYTTTPTATASIQQEVSTTWLATIRPRIGYAFDNTLIYATGGLAMTSLTHSATFSDNFATAVGGLAVNNAFTTGSVSKMTYGWTLGAGIEYAFSRSWTVKAEYLYASFGSVSFDAPLQRPANNLGTIITSSADLTAHILRAGVNYRF